MSKLTPGERAKHWADALMKVWPVLLVLLGTLGYTNKDEIRGLFIVTDEGAGLVELSPFEHYMQTELERLEGMIEVLKADTHIAIDGLGAKLAKRDSVNYQSLDKEIDALQAELIRINGVVQ